jgi:hypothetical protein
MFLSDLITIKFSFPKLFMLYIIFKVVHKDSISEIAKHYIILRIIYETGLDSRRLFSV